MRNQQLLGVLLLGLCLAGLEAVQGQRAEQSGNSAGTKDGSSSEGRGEKRKPRAVQLIEKRPAGVKSLAKKTESPAPAAEVPAGVVRKRTCYGVQVGAFRSRENASKLVNRLSREFDATQVFVKSQGRPVPLHQVVVGCEDDLEKAKQLQEKLAANGTRGFVVKVEPDSPRPGIVE